MIEFSIATFPNSRLAIKNLENWQSRIWKTGNQEFGKLAIKNLENWQSRIWKTGNREFGKLDHTNAQLNHVLMSFDPVRVRFG